MKRILSMMLAVLMLFQLCPLDAMAETATEKGEKELTNTSADYKLESNPDPEAYVTNEVTELRGESEKHFRLSDGSYVAMQYKFPIHYQDADGNWEEIDNSLTLTGQAYTAHAGNVTKRFAPSLAEDQLFSMEYDGCSVALSLLEQREPSAELQPVEEEEIMELLPPDDGETTGSTVPDMIEPDEGGDVIIIEEPEPDDSDIIVLAAVSDVIIIEDDEEVSADDEIIIDNNIDTAPDQSAASEVTIIDTNTDLLREAGLAVVHREDVKAEIAEKAKVNILSDDRKMTLEEAGSLEALGSGVAYKSVFPGVDLLYQNAGYEIKESIVISEPLDAYSFYFGLNTTGLNAVLDENGSVLLTNDGGELIYSIPAPYMFDAAGEQSLDVQYTLTELAEGYVLTVTADSDWINSSDRVFPVTIDPTLVAECKLSNGAMTASYVAEGSPGRIYGTAQTLYFGYSSSWTVREAQIYLGFNSLPSIPANSVVVSANLQMCQTSWSQVVCTSCDMGIYQVTDACPSSGYYEWIKNLTWNSKPTTSGTLLDYATCTQASRGSYLNWDITRSVKEWYQNNSVARALGIKLVDIGKYSSSYAIVATFQGFGGSGSYLSPYLTIGYRYAVGLEDYYSSQSQNIGRAGVGYVGDYNGLLTLVRNDLAVSSTACPVSLAHIYNSAYSAGQIFNNAPGASGYWAMNEGYGWKMNFQQSVAVYDNNYLQYMDADGTIHYFYRSSTSSNTYYDEDGLGLTITANGGSYTMTDRYGSTRYFENGTLSYEQDANGNRVSYIKADGGQVTSITRTLNGGNPETIATIGYNSYGFIIEIKDSAGNKTTFSYTGSAMTKITNPDGTTVSYTYDGNNKLTQARDDESGYAVSYSYDSQGKVSGFSEKAGGVTGASVSVGSSGGVRTYRYSGKDRTMNNGDDVITSSVFDYYGRTISSSSSSADRKLLYGASAAQYSANSGTSATNNRTLISSSVGVQPMNYLVDCGGENVSGSIGGSSSPWRFYGSGSAASSTSVKRTGSRSMAVSRSSMGGDNSVITQAVSGLTPNAWYVLSAYINTSSVTEFGENGAVYIHCAGNNGTPVTWNTGNVGDGWERVYVTAKSDPEGVISIDAVCRDLTGTVYFDDLQIERSIFGESASPSSVNLLNNGDMSRSSGWSFLNASAMQYVNDSAFGRAIKVDGSHNEPRYLSQRVYLDQPGTQTYLYSSWAKAASLPEARRGTFHLWATIFYSDSTTEVQKVPFCTDSTEWQYCVLPIVPKETAKTVSNIVVEFTYNNNANTAYFTNACFTREDAQSYKYNSAGDLVSVSTPDNKTESYSYSGADLISQVTKGSGKYTYEYDGRHNVTKVTNDGVSMGVSYDGRGNTTGSTLTGTGTGQKIASSAAYDSTGNRIVSQTDARGNTVKYSYDTEMSRITGQPTTVTDPRNVAGSTEYNSANGRVISTGIDGTVSLDYAYSGGRLSSMTRTDDRDRSQTYSMSYDSFGNMTGVCVGNVALASYTYGGSNGSLQKMTYGNGNTVSYSYDVLERVSEVYYNGNSTPGAKYTYTGSGTLGRLTDSLAGREYTYNYDGLDRLTSMTEYAGNTGIQLYRAGYDSANRVSKLEYRLSPGLNGTFRDTRSYTYTYRDSDGSLVSMTLPAAGAYTYNYDGLKRLNSRVLKLNGNAFLTREYAYLPGADEDGTTLLVSSLTNRKADGSVYNSYSYSYDELGSITKISGSTEAEYTYDEQGQLLTETVGTGDEQYTVYYTYDSAGNLVSKTKEYTTVVPEPEPSPEPSPEPDPEPSPDPDPGTGSDVDFKPIPDPEISFPLPSRPPIDPDPIPDPDPGVIPVDPPVNPPIDKMSVNAPEPSTGGDTDDNDRITVRETTEYTYGDANWLDLLTAYNGKSITYDEIGNPLHWYDGTEFTWVNGRRLYSASNAAENLNVSYTYNTDGLRMSKTVNGIEHKYIWQGGRLVSEAYGSTELEFFYDESGVPYAFAHKANASATPAMYYYVTNLQGDVVAILDSDGNTAAEYTYDAWGKLLTSSGDMADINPIRYRGYYYDAETELYYLQSRYYDPEICRFINADEFTSTGQTILGCNMFAYCGNNPIYRRDSRGSAWEVVLGSAIAGGLIGLGSYLATNSEWTIGGALLAFGTGLATGALTAIEGVFSLVAYIGAGVVSGVYTACTSDGSTTEKVIAGIITGVSTTVTAFIPPLMTCTGGANIIDDISNLIANTHLGFARGAKVEVVTELARFYSKKIAPIFENIHDSMFPKEEKGGHGINPTIRPGNDMFGYFSIA